MHSLSLSFSLSLLIRQCDPQWGSEQLGTSPTATICTDGCAMTSTAMALSTYGINVDESGTNPENLNQWLTSHHGYVDGDLLVWNSVCALTNVYGQRMCLYEYVMSLPIDDLQKYISLGMPVIININQGTHWVLVIAYDRDNPDTLYVNDPYFYVDSYSYATVLKFAVYEIISTPFAERFDAMTQDRVTPKMKSSSVRVEEESHQESH